MKVNPIQQTLYTKQFSLKLRKLKDNEPKQTLDNEGIAFRGIKGAAKGGAIGAAAALTVAALGGPFGLAILPLWTTVGAIGGHAVEEDNDSPKNGGSETSKS